MPEKTTISKYNFFSRIFARYSDFLDVFPSISSNHQRDPSFRHFFLLILLQNEVPSHQIRLCLTCYCWIGLDEYKDRGWSKDFLLLPLFFYFNLSSPSGIANCTALHAIGRFRRQYYIRCSNSAKYTVHIIVFS